jgi:hypothetical protein
LVLVAEIFGVFLQKLLLLLFAFTEPALSFSVLDSAFGLAQIILAFE